MTFLLVKIASLLALAAFFGSALTWWAVRRRYEDVTEEYTSLRTEWAQWRKAIDERLSRPMAVDLGQVQNQLNSIEGEIRCIEFPNTDLSPVLRAIDDIHIPEPPGVDLVPMMSRLTQLEDRIKAIPLPELPAATDISVAMNVLKSIEKQIASIKIPEPQKPDLGPIAARLNALEEIIRNIKIPSPAAPTDLGPVLQRIGEVERQIKAIQVPQPKEVNLAPAMAHLARIEETVREFRPMPHIDLGPVQARLDETARAVRAINIPAPKEPNLNPVLERLHAIEKRLTQEDEKRAATKIRPGSRNLLLQPDYGKPDDLKRIKGVAEVLEKMLHNIGVYYFWQVAEWDKDDIAYVDGLLTAFKGRIDRDHWISQCIDFAREPMAARNPQAESVTA